MNSITTVIEKALDAHRDAGTHDNPALAQVLADELVCASLDQLAALLNGSIMCDRKGQLILHTNCYDKPYREEEDAHYDSLATSLGEYR